MLERLNPGFHCFDSCLPAHQVISIQVDRMGLEVFERNSLECLFMRRAHHDPGSAVCFECLFPSRGADTPAIAGLQARKTILGHRRTQVVTLLYAEIQECIGHAHANCVGPRILIAGFT